jgi:hypothetical protein
VQMGGSISQAQPTDETADSQFEDIGFYPLLFLVTAAFGVFLATNIAYPFKRPDYFLLADAFLHGRTWIDVALMPTHVDVIDWRGHAYLPFGPGPAFLVMPLVAVLGPDAANAWQPFISSAVAALDVALLALLVRCIQPTARWRDVVWVVVLLAFSLPLWWITVRTGPWHFAQLTAVAWALIGILELLSRRRAWLVGAALGLAILSRTTLVVAIPFVVGLLIVQARRDGAPGIKNAAVFLIFPLLALALTAWYNAARFGSPLESGYALAAVPVFLRDLRSQGLFSLSHLPYNLDLLLFHLPVSAPPPFFLRPDGYGLTVALASPGMALLVKADWSRPLIRWAAMTGAGVLVPSLLYYGGGWIQLGFRYLLDALPFIAILAASAIRTPMGRWWKALIAIGVVVNLWGIAWGYTLWLQ